MIIHTASEGITLCKKLETESAAFYEALAKRFTKDAETFLAFAKENKKNITNIERTYYGVITDAIEGCFCFNLETDNYALKTDVPSSEAAAVAQALAIEDTIIKFYTDASEQSKSLMADVPRVFALVAKKRAERKAKLESLKNN